MADRLPLLKCTDGRLKQKLTGINGRLYYVGRSIHDDEALVAILSIYMRAASIGHNNCNIIVEMRLYRICLEVLIGLRIRASASTYLFSERYCVVNSDLGSGHT